MSFEGFSQLQLPDPAPSSDPRTEEGAVAAGPVVRAVEVHRSARRKRTVAARLEKGVLIVYLPARMSGAEEAQWVEKMRCRFEASGRTKKMNASGRLQRRARELNRRYFEGALTWSSITYVTNQKSRYGSCTVQDATIRLSDSLLSMPDWVHDYVIVHELAHLVVGNHSAAFWELVGRYPLTERARGFLIAKGMEEEI